MMLPSGKGGIGLGVDPVVAIVITLLVGVCGGRHQRVLGRQGCTQSFHRHTRDAHSSERRGPRHSPRATPLYGIPEAYLYLGSASWAGLPASVWIMVAIFVLGGLFLRYHKVGRAIYATGGNEMAAAAAGVRTSRIVIGVYVFSGLMAAFAGILLAGRIGAVTATQGQNLIFSVLAACVIGGISMNGGRGSILGALTGVLLLATLSNLLVLSNIASYWIDASYGFIILLALAVARITGGKERA